MKRKDIPLHKKLYNHHMALGYPDDTKTHKHTSRSLTNTILRKDVVYGVLAFSILYFTYSVGYSRGVGVSNDIVTTHSVTTNDKIVAIEHMQGFSEAYPEYEIKIKSTPTKDTNYQEKEDQSELLSEKEVQEWTSNNQVTISSEFTDKELFQNYDEHNAAPYVTVPDLKTNYNLGYKLPKRNLWWGVRDYEDQYSKFPIKGVIPRLKRNVQLTIDEFHNRFRKVGQPVVFSFENLRDLGFKTQDYTLEELKLMFPFNEEEATTKVQKQFVANGVRRADEELDLGPGLVAIERDEELAKKGKLRSFPRNLKVKLDAIKKLNIEHPPLIRNENGKDIWQLPTVWMGTSSSDTRFHHDCCDNFVMMISGTKRFTLAPTSDWRLLNPNCVGKLKALCWANINDPNDRIPGTNKKMALKALEHINKMIVDVGPGDILYMPAGWFHHIQNLGPTLMVNWWTKGSETCGLMRARNNPDY